MAKRLKSVFTDDMEHCYFTGSPNCHRHHIFYAFEEKTKENTVKRKKNYYLVKSDVLGYARRKGLINGRSKRQISERGT